MMNSLKYALIIVCFTPAISFSQKPTIGIKAGLALCNITIKQVNIDSGAVPPYKTSTRTSALAGLYLNIPSGKKLAFRPGIEVVSKGADDESNIPIKFTYIDFPINVIYKINNTAGNFLIGGGPTIGILIPDSYSLYSAKMISE